MTAVSAPTSVCLKSQSTIKFKDILLVASLMQTIKISLLSELQVMLTTGDLLK